MDSGRSRNKIIRKHYKKKKLPINLLRQAVRERRHCIDLKQKPRKKSKTKIIDFEKSEHHALVHATDEKLREIIENDEVISDIPYDCEPDELLGEIALAVGTATTVYVQRDGLSTLTVMLPQEIPTIANLKRAIEVTARAQLKRELRERQEERLKRRRNETDKQQQQDDDELQKQVVNNSSNNEMIRSTGELVCSTTFCGHHHRANASWRFLWRAYALFNIDTNVPINDANGRKTLIECGIENAATLKFCKREKYFGRKRQ